MRFFVFLFFLAPLWVSCSTQQKSSGEKSVDIAARESSTTRRLTHSDDDKIRKLIETLKSTDDGSYLRQRYAVDEFKKLGLKAEPAIPELLHLMKTIEPLKLRQAIAQSIVAIGVVREDVALDFFETFVFHRSDYDYETRFYLDKVRDEAEKFFLSYPKSTGFLVDSIIRCVRKHKSSSDEKVEGMPHMGHADCREKLIFFENLLKLSYESSRSESFKTYVRTSEFFSRFFNLNADLFALYSPSQAWGKGTLSSVFEILIIILENQKEDLTQEFLSKNTFERFKAFYPRSLQDRKVLFEIARFGMDPKRRPGHSYFHKTPGFIVNRDIKKGAFPNIDTEFQIGFDWLMWFYNHGAVWHLPIIFRELGTLSHPKVVEKIKALNLVELLFQFATLPAPISTFISASEHTMESLAHVLASHPEAFQKEVRKVEPLLGHSILSFSKNNLTKDPDWIHLADKKAFHDGYVRAAKIIVNAFE